MDVNSYDTCKLVEMSFMVRNKLQTQPFQGITDNVYVFNEREGGERERERERERE